MYQITLRIDGKVLNYTSEDSFESDRKDCETMSEAEARWTFDYIDKEWLERDGFRHVLSVDIYLEKSVFDDETGEYCFKIVDEKRIEFL